MQQINLIFDEADLMIVSWICQNWMKQIEISREPKTLFIGKTKSGKSSMLKFLSRNDDIKVGKNLDSETFFPTQINIEVEN